MEREKTPFPSNVLIESIMRQTRNINLCNCREHCIRLLYVNCKSVVREEIMMLLPFTLLIAATIQPYVRVYFDDRYSTQHNPPP